MREILIELCCIFFSGYAFISFEPIQFKLLEIDSIFLKPLKCLACFYFWASAIFMTYKIYYIGFNINELFVWLFTVYILLVYKNKIKK